MGILLIRTKRFFRDDNVSERAPRGVGRVSGSGASPDAESDCLKEPVCPHQLLLSGLSMPGLGHESRS